MSVVKWPKSINNIEKATRISALSRHDQRVPAILDLLLATDKAEAESERLRKALRFYAQDRFEYEDGGSVEEDKGAVARTALKELNQ